jgi:hypothetical protein
VRQDVTATHQIYSASVSTSIFRSGVLAACRVCAAKNHPRSATREKENYRQRACLRAPHCGGSMNCAVTPLFWFAEIFARCRSTTHSSSAARVMPRDAHTKSRTRDLLAREPSSRVLPSIRGVPMPQGGVTLRRFVASLGPLRPAGIGLHVLFGGVIDERLNLVVDGLD